MAATTTTDVLDRAGVSRGALYHHFADRAGLVAAVYEAESAAAVAAAAPPSITGFAIDDLLAGAMRWLSVVARPDTARILIEDGPRELGLVRCREIEERHSLAPVVAALDAARAAGVIETPDTTLLARMVNAILTEAALAGLHAPRRRHTEIAAETERRIRNLLS